MNEDKSVNEKKIPVAVQRLLDDVAEEKLDAAKGGYSRCITKHSRSMGYDRAIVRYARG